jgi:hypothetical protein
MNPDHLSWLGLAATAAGTAIASIAVQVRKARLYRLALKDAPADKRKDILGGIAEVERAERRSLPWSQAKPTEPKPPASGDSDAA